MKLIAPTSHLAEKFGLAGAVDILAGAGFDGADFSAYRSEEFYTDAHPDSYYTELRVRAEAKGIAFLQAHAPHGSSFHDAEKTEKRFHEIVLSMRYASLLGVPRIVVHPCQHLHYVENDEIPERLFEMNMAFYRRLLPYAEEYGIEIATENMWTSDSGVIVHSTCSRPAEMIRYFDEIRHPLFGCCLDLGHTALVREDAAAFIRALGKDRLTCLHVHDADGVRDTHTLPYFGGAVNFERVLAALAEIGYRGDFTYEADGFLTALPVEILPDASRFMERVGRAMIAKIEAYRA